MTEQERRDLLEQYSAATITALELRRRLGDANYGEVLRLLADAGLKLPRAPTEGREGDLARARAWLFPKPGHG